LFTAGVNTFPHPSVRPIKFTSARLSSHSGATGGGGGGGRLRLRLKAKQEEPDAVLTPEGKTVHAQKSAKLGRAREALRRATKQIETARGAMRRKNAEGAVAQWHTLVSAQWTLVDRFESDGKRYVLARENEPLPAAEPTFTRRERQVVALLAIGHHTKLIAYELGISDATVRVLLGRAMRKVGAKTREQLLARLPKRTISKTPGS
jgi:DNA-binding CsgD family transcriptional regulator